jgi:hypothetical protein
VALVIWTAGHSTHPVDELVALLRAARIEVLADVRYDLVMGTDRFRAGLERLLVTRALVHRGVEVRHIRGNGQVVAEAESGPGSPGTTQPMLFGDH